MVFIMDSSSTRWAPIRSSGVGRTVRRSSAVRDLITSSDQGTSNKRCPTSVGSRTTHKRRSKHPQPLSRRIRRNVVEEEREEGEEEGPGRDSINQGNMTSQ